MQGMDEAIAYTAAIIPREQNQNSWILEVCSRLIPSDNVEEWDSYSGGQEWLMSEVSVFE